MQQQAMRLCEWVSIQTKAAMKGNVPLRDGKSIPTWMAYRCLYCGEYFNQTQAEVHFGQTREDRNSKRDGDIERNMIDVKYEKP